MENREALTIFRTIQKCRHQALHTNDCGDCERCQYRLEQEQIDGAVAFVISALKKQEQDRWIPVTERLPELESEVLVTDSFGELVHAFYIEWCGREGFVSAEESKTVEPVKAWRPLPEPYTEGEA